MKTKIYKLHLNKAAINKKAIRAGTDAGFIAGLLGAAVGMFVGNGIGHGCNSALFGAMIIGPLTGLVFGFLRAAYVWCDVLLTFRGHLAGKNTAANRHGFRGRHSPQTLG